MASVVFENNKENNEWNGNWKKRRNRFTGKAVRIHLGLWVIWRRHSWISLVVIFWVESPVVVIRIRIICGCGSEKHWQKVKKKESKRKKNWQITSKLVLVWIVGVLVVEPEVIEPEIGEHEWSKTKSKGHIWQKPSPSVLPLAIWILVLILVSVKLRIGPRRHLLLFFFCWMPAPRRGCIIKGNDFLYVDE